MTAITAITAQNTVGVELVDAVPPEMIVAQVRAVADDIGVDAVKIGMLGDEPTIEAVVEALDLVGERAGRGRPGDGRRERRGRCSTRTRRRRWSSGSCRARRSSRPTCPRRASSPGSARTATPRSSRAAMHALGPERGRRHRRAHRGRRRPASSTATGSLRIDGPAVPGRRRARLGLHPLLGARRPPRPRRRAARGGRAGRARSPPRRSATACASSAPAPGPVDVFGLAAALRRARAGIIGVDEAACA